MVQVMKYNAQTYISYGQKRNRQTRWAKYTPQWWNDETKNEMMRQKMRQKKTKTGQKQNDEALTSQKHFLFNESWHQH